LPGTIACLIVAIAFRHTAGGAHSDFPVKCAAVTMVIFPLLAVVANKLAILPLMVSDFLSFPCWPW